MNGEAGLGSIHRAYWTHVDIYVRRRGVIVGLTLLSAYLVVALVGVRLENHAPVAPIYGVDIGWRRSAGCIFYFAPLITAILIGGRKESRHRDQRLCDGESDFRQSFLDIGLALTATTVAVGATTLLFIGAEAIESVTSGPGRGETTTWNHNLRVIVISAPLTLVSALTLGFLIGKWLSNRVMAATVALLIAIATQILSLTANSTLPELGWFYAATPRGAAFILSGLDTSTVNGSGPIVVAAVSFVVLLAMVPLAAFRELRRLTKSSSPGAHDSSMHARSRVWQVAIVTAMVGFGVAVPTAMKREVPWSLRPLWLSDEAHHRTSVDIARQLLRDVQAGHAATANLFTTSRNATELLGPYLGAIRRGDVTDVSVDTRAFGDPGLVVVTLTRGVTFDLCAQRKIVGWRITQLRSDGQCPKASVG